MDLLKTIVNHDGKPCYSAKKLLSGAVIGVWAIAACGRVTADGCFMPSDRDWKKHREAAYITEPEQKAAIYFHNGVEDLIISPSYKGRSSDFAWVVPVPSRPKVEIVRGALFHELAKITVPNEQSLYAPRGKSDMEKRSIPSQVQILEEKTVGAYHVTVLSATDAGALQNWLASNHYHLPIPAIKPMHEYVKEGWTFVASRIKDEFAGDGLRTGTLAPLRLTFAADRPVYPMRISAANPTPFKVLVYLLFPPGDNIYRGDVYNGSIVKSGRNAASQGSLTAISHPTQGPTSARFVTSLSGNIRQYPTLSKLTTRGMSIFVQETGDLPPNACTSDYVWAPPPSFRR
jgi:hypothetical protein